MGIARDLGGRAPAMTPRQREVMAGISSGLANKEIAASLGISEEGVKAHVSRLLARFGVRNRAGLAALGRDFADHDGDRSVGVKGKITVLPSKPRRPYAPAMPQRVGAVGPAVLLGVARLRATLEAVDIAFEIARGLPAGATSASLIHTLQSRIRTSLRETDRLERQLMGVRSPARPASRRVTRSRATARS